MLLFYYHGRVQITRYGVVGTSRVWGEVKCSETRGLGKSETTWETYSDMWKNNVTVGPNIISICGLNTADTDLSQLADCFKYNHIAWIPYKDGEFFCCLVIVTFPVTTLCDSVSSAP